MEMDPAGLETPLRKRRRSTTPFSSLRHPNKRARSSSIFSPSPKIVRFDPLSHGEDIDIVMESNVPESPIALRRSASVTAVSAQSPQTPGGAGIDNPFAKLSLKTPRQGKENVTPMVAKSSDHTKSAKRSARKTPGSAKSQKALPFRIKVQLSESESHAVFFKFAHRPSCHCYSRCDYPPTSITYRLVSRVVAKDILGPSHIAHPVN